MDSATGSISGALIAGIVLGAIVLIITTIILIWFISTLSGIKRHLKSIDLKLTKSNLSLGDIKMYNFKMMNNTVSSSDINKINNEKEQEKELETEMQSV